MPFAVKSERNFDRALTQSSVLRNLVLFAKSYGRTRRPVTLRLLRIRKVSRRAPIALPLGGYPANMIRLCSWRSPLRWKCSIVTDV